ncbi:MAG: hypothetical protein E6Q76_12025 [Rhizobium sp.]|nr:MAG: hypothetical protein E6Q76_12025 [Rhizobium sp.]
MICTSLENGRIAAVLQRSPLYFPRQGSGRSTLWGQKTLLTECRFLPCVKRPVFHIPGLASRACRFTDFVIGPKVVILEDGPSGGTF